jgi:hypothetical protein
VVLAPRPGRKAEHHAKHHRIRHRVHHPGLGLRSDDAARQCICGRWERRVLAEGVVLDVRDDASLEARQIAEDFQSEIRSRYINARQ